MIGITILYELSEDVEVRLASSCGQFGKPYLDEMAVDCF
jgi:hypothetical protein